MPNEKRRASPEASSSNNSPGPDGSDAEGRRLRPRTDSGSPASLATSSRVSGDQVYDSNGGTRHDNGSLLAPWEVLRPLTSEADAADLAHSDMNEDDLEARRRRELLMRRRRAHLKLARWKLEAQERAAAGEPSLVPPSPVPGPSHQSRSTSGSPSMLPTLAGPLYGRSGSSGNGPVAPHQTSTAGGGGSFFSSASNMSIQGGQFNADSSTYRNNTNLTINLHPGLHPSSIGVYENPFDPLGTAGGPQSLTQLPPSYHPYTGLPNFHTPGSLESMHPRGRAFPSTRYIRDGYTPMQPYDDGRSFWDLLVADIRGESSGESEASSGSGSRAQANTSGRIAPRPIQPSTSSSSLNRGADQMDVDPQVQPTRSNQVQVADQGTEPLQAQKSSDIYCRHLSVKQRGYPLWIPEPNCYLPVQYQRKGISIGDVGIITAAGSFDYLFNVLLAHDHPFNMGRVPPGFAPLSPLLDPSDIRGQLEFRSNSFIASSSVRRTLGNPDDLGTTFHISASEGAILTIPDGALSEDLGNLVRLRQYMSENVESWYLHANGPRGRELANGDLRLVIGCDKTTAWGMAAFADLSQGEDTRLRFRPVGTAAATPQPQPFQTYGWELHSGTAEVRSGPDAREIRTLSAGDTQRGGEPMPYENQCIFVRTLNATLHDAAWLELMAELMVPGGSGGAASSQDSTSSKSSASSGSVKPPSQRSSASMGSGGGDPSGPTESPSSRVTVHKPEVPAYLTSHPSKSLNEALLQRYMDVKMAITDDSDWSAVLTENDIVMPKPQHLTTRILTKSTPMIDERGVVYLEKNTTTYPPFTLPQRSFIGSAGVDATGETSASQPGLLPSWLPPLRIPTPSPPASDMDEFTALMRRSTRMAPMRHQSGSPSSM